MKIKIFCEAGSAFGWGHLVRCRRFANLLRAYCSDIFLYCRGDYKDISKIQNQAFYKEKIGFEWFDIKTFESELEDSDVIIIDSYEASDVLYQIAFEKSKLLIVLDDTRRLHYPSEAVILNGALGAQRLYKPSNKNLVGIEFAIVDSRFLYARVAQKFVRNVFLSFGGTNMAEIILKALKTLENFPYTVHIVSPKSYNLSQTPKQRVYQQLEPAQMADLMKKCDIAITAGGGTLYELAMTQTPTLIIPIALNQKFQSQQWAKTKAMKITNLKNLFQDIKTLELEEVRQDMISKFSNFVFGEKLLPRLKELFVKEGINKGDKR